MLYIYTGDGKGKTSAGLGLIIRAYGAGLSCAAIFFDKNSDYCNELTALKELGIQSHIFGANRITTEGAFRLENTDKDFEEAAKGIGLAREILAGGPPDVLVLDEILNVVRIGLAPLQEITNLVDSWPREKYLVLTGRGLPEEIKTRADLVSDIQQIKHPFTTEGAIAQGAMNVPSNVVDGRGIFLTGIWYPQPDQTCNFHLTATLPDGYEAISEAETIRKTTPDGQTIFSFAFPHPLDSIHLIATNRYTIVQDHFNGIEIFAYFFHEDAGLAQTYFQHTKRYLRLYENLIGRYPYKRFSIVENFLPTGYSMPTYTLLGKEVVRLPFIVETSLGHEILHQWKE